MYQESFAAGEPAGELPIGLTVDDRGRSPKLAAVFSAGVSVALLAMVAAQFRNLDFDAIMRMIPVSPVFWLAFVVYYLVQPISELFIYRRLWNLPLSGFGALLRKLVCNELLLGYLGEVQFYAWARSRINLTAAPFGAIKDVTILSALTGNIATLALLILAWPLVSSGALALELKSTFASLGVVLVTSFAILLLRQKLFSLERRDLWFVANVHGLRIASYLVLAALLWHQVLPAVPIAIWLVLATLRMLVSRLPLIPNKDVVFAGLAVVLLGRETQLGNLMTMMAGLVLAAHLFVGACFALAELIGAARRGLAVRSFR
ncbi:MAG: hypothetical protein JF593_01380 [Novosphingobium sp.]|nr:hypothetical protein [Novosphingobium sp.]